MKSLPQGKTGCWLLFAVAAVACGLLSDWCAGATRTNVLLIIVDDLRPEASCFGVDGMVTPQLDRLAAQSVTFERAYANAPVCGASRASFMTGIRTTRTRFATYQSWAEVDSPNTVKLHQHFRNHGYYAASIGKVFHHAEDCREGWSREPLPFRQAVYSLPESRRQAFLNRRRPGRGPAWEQAEWPDDALPDGQIANLACERLTQLSESEEPFFLAVGFYRPHLPLVAPKTYWEHYPTSAVSLPPNFTTRPIAPEVAFTRWGSLRHYQGIPKQGQVSDATARQLIAGYRACVSFTDAQLGKVLDRLHATGLDENTAVVLIGDHGWNLGEHGMWAKHTCFEPSMRTAMLVRAPMLDRFRAGVRTRALTELIDIYPTICELTGLPLPAHLQGVSVTPVLRDPSIAHRTAAVGRFRLGDTIRTDRYRYAEYREADGTLIGRMLYDHQIDPSEDTNLAEDPSYADTVASLAARLKQESAATATVTAVAGTLPSSPP